LIGPPTWPRLHEIIPTSNNGDRAGRPNPGVQPVAVQLPWKEKVNEDINIRKELKNGKD